MDSGHARYPYSAIVDRPAFEWPGGHGLAVYVALNVEAWPFAEGEGAQLTSGEPAPNVRAYSWRDYGNRVGLWNLLEVFDALDIPLAVNLNSLVYEQCPRVVEPFRERGDEIVAHGRTNGERQSRMAEPEERSMIAEATAAFVRHEASQPGGWLGPYLSESLVSPELLVEAGYRYTLDWFHDDQPTWLATGHGPLLNVPYPIDSNDSTVLQHHAATPAAFADQLIEELETYLELSTRRALVAPIALHPFLVGRPARLAQLRRALRHLAAMRDRIWLTRPGEIAAFYAERFPAPAPA